MIIDCGSLDIVIGYKCSYFAVYLGYRTLQLSFINFTRFKKISIEQLRNCYSQDRKNKN